MYWQTGFAASLLVVRAHAGIADLVAEGVLTGRSSAMLERRMELAVANAIEPDLYRNIVVKRQSTNLMTAAGVMLNPDGTVNITAWDTQVNAACNTALAKLPESSNPSGTCICYNLPVLNNDTGAFEADLRLYSISTPTGEFAGIPPQNIQVGLSYVGASVSPVSAQTAEKLVSRQNEPQGSANLKLLQTYLFVGQIDKAKLASIQNSNLTTFDAQLEALVMPILTLTARNSAGQEIATNVSSNEAAFVAGVFSQDIVLSEFAAAQIAVNDVVSQLLEFNNGTLPANETIAFVLPGVQILIFPIGLVITSIWLVAGLAAITFGTVQRMGYREQFRRRTARAGPKGAGRI